jgi:hypothetical protein
MACPICVSPEGAAITAGIRAGAIVLMLAAAVIGVLIARFALRLWRLSARLQPAPYEPNQS